MALLDDTASATSVATRSRTTALVVVAIAIVALCVGLVGGAVWKAAQPVPLSAPLFGTNDGLPSTLVAGKEYTARISAGVGSDWAGSPQAPWIGDQQSFGMGAILTYTGMPDGSIMCTDGTMPAGAVLTMTCPFTVPDAPGPATVTIGWPGITDVAGPTTRTYAHTIVR